MSSIRFDLPHLSNLRSKRDQPSSEQGNTSSDGSGTHNPWIQGLGTISVSSGPFLSIVLPARNEAESLPLLIEEITQALRSLCSQSKFAGHEDLTGFEIIVVDDSSTDKTSTVLKHLAEVYSELRPLRLIAPVGQSGALTAGIRFARGNWIATLDADLQNDPSDLVNLWNALAGYDAVLGWRVTRADSWIRRVISLMANTVRNTVLGQSIHDTGCSIRIFPRAVALRLPSFQGMHRFLGSLLLREGCRIIQVPVNHRPRLHGRSHYNLWNRSLHVLVDLVGVMWLMNRAVLYEPLAEMTGWTSLSPKVPMRVQQTNRKSQGVY